MKRKFVFVLLFVVLLSALLPCTAFAAGGDSVKIPSDASVYDGRSYKVYELKKSWTDAKEYCESMGGHLVTITSAGEQRFVSDLVQRADVPSWIGASYSDGRFSWVTGEGFSYTNWDDGEPSFRFGGSSEPYVGIYSNDTETEYSTTGKWNDFSRTSDTVRGFVCEWEAQCITEDGTVYGEHRVEDWTVSQNPTCTGVGQRVQRCERCRLILNREQIPATGHAEKEWEVAQAPTCTASGIRQRKCEYCDGVLAEESIPATDHTAKSWEVAEEPTCTATGVRQRKCEHCDTVLEEEAVAPLGHTYGEFSVIAGNALIPPIVKAHRCEVCSYAEAYKDWGYIWVPILAAIAAVGIVIGVISYFKAFKRK